MEASGINLLADDVFVVATKQSELNELNEWCERNYGLPAWDGPREGYPIAVRLVDATWISDLKRGFRFVEFQLFEAANGK